MFCRPFQYGLAGWLVLTGGVDLSMAADVKPGGADLEQRYHVTHWSSEDGLPHNRVAALAQTPDGYLWVGTWFGLARFDGLRFTVFDEANTAAMNSQEINALAVDNEGTLWIGTVDGLLRCREGQFARFTRADGLPDRAVWRLAASPGGGIWMQCGWHILHWRDGHPTLDVKVLFAPNEAVRSLKVEADGSATVVTSRAVKRITPRGELEAVELPAFTAEPNADWGGVCQIEDRLWISGQKGLWLFRNGSWKQVRAGVCRADLGTFMGEDRNGSLWVNRREAGFWRCTGETAEPVNLGNRGAEKSVGCMLEDAEGHVWFGSAQGLFQLRPTLIAAVTTENGLPHDQCRSVCEGPDGAVWVETQGGLARIHGSQVNRFPGDPWRIARHSILVDPAGLVWLGNGHDGLIRWRPGGETNRLWDTGPRVTVEALFLDRDRHVWVGTDRGVTWFENGEVQAGWGETGLPTDNIRSIYQTRDGTMWFGTWKAGAVRWKAGQASRLPQPSPVRRAGETRETLDPPTVTRFTTADGLADDRVLVFHEDVDGVLWIGTHHGLNRFKDGRFFTFRTEQGLLDNFMNWMEEDEFGQFWFSCNRGIFRMDRSELNAVAAGRKPRASVAVYGPADGMPTPETEGEHQPAGCKGGDGRIWFPTAQGVVVIDPRRVNGHNAAEVPPPVVIEQVVADGEVIFGDSSSRLEEAQIGFESARENGASLPRLLRLPPGRARLLKIRFTANSFANPRRVRFRYRLSNEDDTWREATEDRVAYYTNLRPGRHRFEVKAATPHGIWNETPAAFEFSLAPYFWQTWMFYALGSITLMGLAGGLVGRRLHVQRRILRLELQRAMEQERARLARDLHDELGTALTGLALEIDLARRGVAGDSAMNGRLQGMADHSRAMASRMREVVWAISPRCDDVPALATFLEQHAAQFVRSAGLRCRLEFPEVLPSLPVAAETRHQLALGVREALTNVVRHAHASEVVLSLRVEGRTLVLRVVDNGIGFDTASMNGGGHGLASLRSRLDSFAGRVQCESAPGGGTAVTFHLPLVEAPKSSNS